MLRLNRAPYIRPARRRDNRAGIRTIRIWAFIEHLDAQIIRLNNKHRDIQLFT
jgi:hypothetical protein